MSPANSITSTLTSSLNSILLFLPHFISGLIILIVGLIVASVAKAIVRRGAQLLNVGRWLERAHIESEQTTAVWVNVLSQIVYWFILLSFLVPTFNAWQIPTITVILNRFILYLPNVFAAVIIGFVGIVVANIAFDAAKNASGGLGDRNSNILANAARYSIIFFAILMALNQLGISSNLIAILLAGVVAMAAIAGGLGIGLSIGLGGQETIREGLHNLVSNRGMVGAKGGEQRINGKKSNARKKTASRRASK